MAISKLILNGEVQMDVTSDTVTAGSMLSGTTATKNDGTKATGTIATKTSSDLTVSGATVTAPAGYYANAASKAVATTTHPNPSASITSSTGVVTASHTQGTGYVTGGTTTGTLNLTTQAGKTVTPTEAAQTAVASYRWTTGNVNVAAISSTYVGTGVTTRSAADLTASGSVVTAPAGYYANAASKAVATTTHPNPSASIASSTGVVTASHTQTAGYVTAGTTTGTLNLTTQSAQTITPTETAQTIASYRWLTGTQTIAGISSTYVGTGVPKKSAADVTIANNTGVVTAPAGYYSTAAAKTLTTKAGETLYPSTADQTISSYRWLIGNQTIKSVTTSNLTAENIAEGVTVKVGDSSNASRITQVTGTHSGAPQHTVTLTSNGSASQAYVAYNNTYYYTSGNEISVNDGDTILVYQTYGNSNYIYLNGVQVASGANASYSLAVSCDVEILFTVSSGTSTAYITELNGIEALNVTQNGTYTASGDIKGYSPVTVNVSGGGGITVDQIAMRTITGAMSGSATTIASNAFSSCSSITAALFPSCTSIGSGAFAYCIWLSTISFPVCSSVDMSAFMYCTSLTSVDFPSCTTLASYAFGYCSTKLTTISFPVCSSVGSSAFVYCSSLTSAIFPSCTIIGSYAFAYCSNLTTASFPKCSTINNYVFRGCRKLLSLYLLGSSIPTLSGTSVFYSTPIGGLTTQTGGVYGSIFVPASLYNSYLTAANWSSVSSRFVSV